MNIKSILKQSIENLEKAEIRSASLDAQVLICHVLKKDKAFLLTHPEYELDLIQKNKIKKLINRRTKNEPIAYITGHREFYNYNFLVDKHTLIPRPESEELVKLALNRIQNLESGIWRQNTQIPNTKYQILDMGTGSGCLIITLIKELLKDKASYPLLSAFSFFAADISKKALSVAKKNAERLLYSSNVSEKSTGPSSRLRSNNNINFVHSDLFSNKKLHQKFDLIIANLPYVPKLLLHISSIDDICNNEGPLRCHSCASRNLKIPGSSLPAGRQARDDIDYEPENAIFADDNGASEIKRFMAQAKDRITNNGLILLELDPRNAIEIKKEAGKYFSKAKVDLQRDLSGLNRYLKIQL